MHYVTPINTTVNINKIHNELYQFIVDFYHDSIILKLDNQELLLHLNDDGYLTSASSESNIHHSIISELQLYSEENEEYSELSKY